MNPKGAEEGVSGYRMLFEATSDGMLLADADRTVSDANPLPAASWAGRWRSW